MVASVSPKLDIGVQFDTLCEKFKKTNAKIITKGENIIIQEFTSERVQKLNKDYYRCKTDEERIQLTFNKLVSKDCITINQEDGYEEYNMSLDDIENVYDYACNIVDKNKRKNRIDSVRKSRQKVLDYAFCNPQLKTFITLTYADNVIDYNIALADFQKFRKRVNNYMQRNFNKKFEFICTFERQKRGAWHMHLLTNFDLSDFTPFTVSDWVTDDGRTKTEECKIVERLFSKKFWNDGFCGYRELDEVGGSAYYLSKYMSKETDVIMLEDNIKRRYYCSNGLNKPVVQELDFQKKEDIELIDRLTQYLISNDTNYIKKINVFNDYTTYKDKMQGLERRVVEMCYMKVLDKL